MSHDSFFSRGPHSMCQKILLTLILKSFPGSDYLSPPPLPPSSLGLIWLYHSFPVQPVFNAVARVNLQKHKWERATPAHSSISLRVKACLGNFSLFSGYQSQARTKPQRREIVVSLSYRNSCPTYSDRCSYKMWSFVRRLHLFCDGNEQHSTPSQLIIKSSSLST